jgi:hypothetical protein
MDNIEVNWPVAKNLLREARAHLKFEMFGDERYYGIGTDTADEWFAAVDALIGSETQLVAVNAIDDEPTLVDPCDELF